MTSLDVSRETVVEVATNGGRERWREENEGFNTQKNSGLNLEHAYSHTCWAAYYFLLQIAHLLLQLVEKGSLLRQLAQEQGKRTAVELFGSLKNMGNGCWRACGTGTGPTRPSIEPEPARSRFAWTAVSRRWRVGVFQVQPSSSGSGRGHTRSPLRARSPTAFPALGRHPRLFRMPATRPRSGFLRAGWCTAPCQPHPRASNMERSRFAEEDLGPG